MEFLLISVIYSFVFDLDLLFYFSNNYHKFAYDVISFRVIERHLGWFYRLLRSSYNEVVVSIYCFIVNFSVLQMIILRCMARFGSIGSKIKNRYFVVATCFENQPRLRRLQTINSSYCYHTHVNVQLLWTKYLDHTVKWANKTITDQLILFLKTFTCFTFCKCHWVERGAEALCPEAPAQHAPLPQSNKHKLVTKLVSNLSMQKKCIQIKCKLSISLLNVVGIFISFISLLCPMPDNSTLQYMEECSFGKDN